MMTSPAAYPTTAIFPPRAPSATPPPPPAFTLPDHQGNPNHKPFLLFSAAPTEIGRLRTAESTLGVGAQRMHIVARIAISFGIAFGTFVLMGFLGAAEPRGTFQDWLYSGVILLPPFGFLYGMFATRFKGTCSYVGEQGVSRAFIEKRPSAPPSTDLLLFAQAMELHTRQTRHYVNGLYFGTFYEYTWNDANGAKLYQLKGKYHGRTKPPKSGDAFHFARAAEMSWSQHCLQRVQDHLKTEGSIPFRVDNARWIRVGQGFLEFHFGDSPVVLMRDDIARVSLAAGRFSFKHKDAKWYSSEGKYTFSYGGMANAMVFLLALDRLMGYRWNSSGND